MFTYQGRRYFGSNCWLLFFCLMLFTSVFGTTRFMWSTSSVALHDFLFLVFFCFGGPVFALSMYVLISLSWTAPSLCGDENSPVSRACVTGLGALLFFMLGVVFSIDALNDSYRDFTVVYHVVRWFSFHGPAVILGVYVLFLMVMMLCLCKGKLRGFGWWHVCGIAAATCAMAVMFFQYIFLVLPNAVFLGDSLYSIHFWWLMIFCYVFILFGAVCCYNVRRELSQRCESIRSVFNMVDLLRCGLFISGLAYVAGRLWYYPSVHGFLIGF